MKTKFLTSVLILIFSGELLAAENASGKITYIGCHNDDSGICYVNLDTTAFGKSACNKTADGNKEFRFDNGNTSAGKRAYASLLAASLAGKSIVAYLDGCTVQGTAKLVYYHVFP